MDFNYHPGNSFQQQAVDTTLRKLEHQSKENDMPALRKELSNVIFVLSKLVDLIHDKQIPFPNWMKHSEVLFVTSYAG